MIFSIRDLSFELGSLFLEGWLAFAARVLCALLILLAAWLVRRWLTKKGFPALLARSWHFAGTPILLRSFAEPVQRHSRPLQTGASGLSAGHDPAGMQGPVCSL